jgi:S-methylmethionine-dependent homocysteine/selenocysteine methylase
VTSLYNRWWTFIDVAWMYFSRVSWSSSLWVGCAAFNVTPRHTDIHFSLGSHLTFVLPCSSLPTKDGIPYCGIDLILFETVPSYMEAQAIHQLLQETPYAVPSMVSFSCNSLHTVCHGEPIAQCVALFNDLNHVSAVGVNCTKPRFITSLLQDIQGATQNKTLIVYPDGGEEWDAEARTWKVETKADPHEFGAMCKSWIKQFGSDFIIGGCCGTTALHISSISHSLVDQQ